MSTKHLRRSAHPINENAWWYEEDKGICVVVAQPNLHVDQLYIPWRLLRNALKRLDKKERKVGP